jgi:hypothetical protein
MQLAKDRAKDNDLGGAEDTGLWLSLYMKPRKPLSVGGVNKISLHVNI